MTKSKLPLTDEQQEWLVKVEQDPEKANANPMVKLHGLDSGGHKCRDCALLFQKRGFSRRYYKCALRRNTNGPGTDHRVRWDACKKFEEAHT